MRLRSSSRCSIRLMPGSSARSVTAARALPIASAGSTMVGCLLLWRFFNELRAGLCAAGSGAALASSAVWVAAVGIAAACGEARLQPARRWKAAECADRSLRLTASAAVISGSGG